MELARRGFFSTILAGLFAAKGKTARPVGGGRKTLIYACINEKLWLIEDWCKNNGFAVERVLMVQSPKLLDVIRAADCTAVVCSPLMAAKVFDKVRAIHLDQESAAIPSAERGRMGKAVGHDWYMADIQYGF